LSEENVALVRAALDASARGDAAAFMAALDADIEWTPVSEDPEYRVHRGIAEVTSWLAGWSTIFPDMHWEAERFLDAGGDTVVALVRFRGRGGATGAHVGTQAYGVVFTVRGGKIVRILEAETGTALKAAGLQE
jgi:ketosteroid isomerase-like protein